MDERVAVPGNPFRSPEGDGDDPPNVPANRSSPWVVPALVIAYASFAALAWLVVSAPTHDPMVEPESAVETLEAVRFWSLFLLAWCGSLVAFSEAMRLKNWIAVAASLPPAFLVFVPIVIAVVAFS